MTFLKHAWRNIWRNGKRTGITIAAITLNTAILIASYALMEGMVVDMLNNATRMVVGDVQVHAPEYRTDRSMYQAIKKPQLFLDAAREAGIKAAPRSYGFGLVSSGPKSAGGIFWGVDPAAERQAFELASEVYKGSYLDDQASRKVVLGRKLAKSLKVDVGSEIVAVVQAADGSLGNELFTVAGILKIMGEEIDRGAVIIHRADFQELFVSGDRVHEIALNAWGKLTPERVAKILSDVVHKDKDKKEEKQKEITGPEISTWRQLMPQMASMVDMMDAAIFIFGFIFFLAAGLGVMNTMLMATYERVREFGILKAIGATPWRILRDITAEAFVMAFVSTIIGTIIGVAASLYFAANPINLEAFGGGSITFSGVAFDPLWRAALSVKVVYLPVVLMWIICMLAALYPAAKAARLDPVRAMTHL